MRYKSYLFLLLLFLIIYSCNSFDNNEDNTFILSEILIEDVEKLIQEESYLLAIQNIDYLLRNEKIENTVLLNMKNNAVSEIEKLYISSLENSDYREVLRLFLTLKNISNEEYEITEKEILLEIAREYKEKRGTASGQL